MRRELRNLREHATAADDPDRLGRGQFAIAVSEKRGAIDRQARLPEYRPPHAPPCAREEEDEPVSISDDTGHRIVRGIVHDFVLRHASAMDIRELLVMLRIRQEELCQEEL